MSILCDQKASIDKQLIYKQEQRVLSLYTVGTAVSFCTTLTVTMHSRSSYMAWLGLFALKGKENEFPFKRCCMFGFSLLNPLVRFAVFLSVCLSVCLTVCLSVCLSD